MKKIFFIKLQFQSVEYSVYVSLEILILLIGIILRFVTEVQCTYIHLKIHPQATETQLQLRNFMIIL